MLFARNSLRGFSSSTPTHTPVCIIGGGCAGVNVAAQLSRVYKLLDHQIRVFEPSRVHYYQPGFTMVGGGLMKAEKTREYASRMVRKGVCLTNLAVKEIDPERNTITAEDGSKFTYEQLIIAAGVSYNIGAIKGLESALADPDVPVATIYSPEGAVKWSKIRESYKGGKAIFTDAPAPIKCAAAPQKIVHLSIDTWNKNGVKYDAEMFLNGLNCFSSPFYEPSLRKQLLDKNVGIHFTEKLIEVNGQTREAVFLNTQTNTTRVQKFDTLHTVPYHKPAEFIARSGLGDATGYLDLDSGTLQSKKYKNIWGLGDSSNLPTSKTCSAVYSQSPILLKNLMDVWKEGRSPSRIYNGYAGCPALVGNRKLMLCEFLYGGVESPTFFRNQFVPQQLFYFMKLYIFPWTYFHLAPRGLWYGKDHLLNPIV